MRSLIPRNEILSTRGLIMRSLKFLALGVEFQVLWNSNRMHLNSRNKNSKHLVFYFAVLRNSKKKRFNTEEFGIPSTRVEFQDLGI